MLQMSSGEKLHDCEATDDEFKGVCYLGISIIAGLVIIIAATVYILL